MEQQKAKDIYFSIGHAWCPALGDYVAFSSKGFRHLIRKRGLSRSQNEQLRRLSLIAYAKQIVENSKLVASHRVENSNRIVYSHDNKRRETARIDFWSLKANKNGRVITVVIRQSSGGTKHFLSIF